MNWLDRLKQERLELFHKHEALSRFLNSDEPSCISIEQIHLMLVQFSCMTGYLKILDLRLREAQQ